MDEKQGFLNMFEREFKTTKRALEAFPDKKLDLKPHEKSRNARELASLFAMETGMMAEIAEKMIVPSGERKISDKSVKDIVFEYEKSYKEAVAAIKKTPAEKFGEEMDFFGTKMRMADVLWEFMMDQIHHRGQFSIYLRMAGAKVPPIYGPTADYPNGEADLK